MSSKHRGVLGQLGLVVLVVSGAALPAGAAGLTETAAAPPIGLDAQPGVQPGGEVRIGGAACTLNFLFRGGDGHRYIGTAGHCIVGGDEPVTAGEGDPKADDGSTGPSAKERVWAPGKGPEATDRDDKRIGEFAYAVLDDPKDFALIRLDKDVEASPEMAHFGGPTGINSDITSEMVTLQFYGYGLGFGSVIPARTMFATGLPDPDHVYAIGAAAPGDSGAGVISDDGRAVGVLVTGGVHTGTSNSSEQPVPEFGDIGLTRLAPQMVRAAEILGFSIDLVTAG
ncbi:MAG: trypsin-like serine protease [Acidimicrobiia bacterium]